MQEMESTNETKTWTKIYIWVMGVLLVIIFLLFLFTKHFQ